MEVWLLLHLPTTAAAVFLIMLAYWCSCILSQHCEISQSGLLLAEATAYCEAMLQAKIGKDVVFTGTFLTFIMQFAVTGLLLQWSMARGLLVN